MFYAIREADLKIQAERLFNGEILFQYEDGFKLGQDSVLLSAFASPKKGSCGVDLCCGNGALSLLLFSRERTLSITGVEISERQVKLCERSFRLADKDRLSVICADAAFCYTRFDKKRVDFVICNPPYFSQSQAYSSEELGAARSEASITFAKLCFSASRILKTGGRFYFVYTSSRIQEAMSELERNGFAAKYIMPVYHTAFRPADIFMCEACRGGGNGGTKLLRPFFVCGDESGGKSADYIAVYRGEKIKR